MRFGVGGGLWAWVGGAGAVLLVELCGFVDEIARRGEGLGVELIADGLPARFVDCGVVLEGLLELVGLCDGSELGECEVVELADS